MAETNRPTQTAAQIATFGDNTIDPVTKLQNAMDARKAEAANLAANQATATAQAQALNEGVANRNRWAALLQSLRGRRQATNSVADLVGSLPNMGR